MDMGSAHGAKQGSLRGPSQVRLRDRGGSRELEVAEIGLIFSDELTALFVSLKFGLC